jgi:hypothetical protein
MLELGYYFFFSALKRSNDSTRIVITAIMGIAFGVCIGISISSTHLSKVKFTTINHFSVASGTRHPFKLFKLSLRFPGIFAD